MGEPERSLLIASTAGYGFIAVLEDMVTRNTKGKAFLSLSEGAVPLSPIPIEGEGEELLVAAVTRQGRMLAFPIGELPRLPKGKGNKIIHIHSKEVHSGEDGLAFLKLLSSRHKLVVHAGKRSFTMSFNLVRDFLGERGKRGKKLPRGFQRVTELASEQVGA
jgi:topoisomerase-4 subunit A